MPGIGNARLWASPPTRASASVQRAMRDFDEWIQRPMSDSSTPIFHAPLGYRRHPTRVVAVGHVLVGGDNPIRVQSMLTCNTWDVPKVLEEMSALAKAGCEIIRLTVPTRKDLHAMPAIREGMQRLGLIQPLVADIHFNPALALGVVPHVEKVRINPGNFVDTKRFEVREYTQAQYDDELKRVEETLLPLINELKTHGRAMRIGVNHGSLSDRILNRHGDTPEGMVECAMEYLRVCAANDYHEIIVSMKSSNPLVVIQAYRLLVLKMTEAGMDYPLHLGVTEAGDGVDGRLKSAIGIGALLCDGLGDTIRVSLTEPAVNEIPAARELVAAVNTIRQGPSWPQSDFSTPVRFTRRPSVPILLSRPVSRTAPQSAPQRELRLGGKAAVAFFGVGNSGVGNSALAGNDGHTDIAKRGGITGRPPEGDLFDAVLLPPTEDGVASLPQSNIGSELRLTTPAQLLAEDQSTVHDAPCLVLLASETAHSPKSVDSLEVRALLASAAHSPVRFPHGVLLVLSGSHLLHPLRRLSQLLAEADGEAARGWALGVLVPEDENGMPPLGVAAEIGSLSADGLLDAIICPTADPAAPMAEYCKTLLQAARLRAYKTEYISCPSCGRTLFDLQETTARIKARTEHLKGLKIGVMGCIVNGPGEMADADFGYVGGAPGKVSLYQGQTCVERGIPADQAVDRLVELIKADDRWEEPA